MKNSLRLYSVFFIVIIAFALYSCSSKKRALAPDGRHYVVLLVDVEKIKPNSKGRDFCNFPDKYPYPNDSIENYTTDVLRGDTVVWIGISTSAPNEDNIIIEKISHHGGPNVVETQPSTNGKVVGIIKEDAKRKKKEKYVIHFKVIKEDFPPRTFRIDPKLLVH